MLYLSVILLKNLSVFTIEYRGPGGLRFKRYTLWTFTDFNNLSSKLLIMTFDIRAGQILWHSFLVLFIDANFTIL